MDFETIAYESIEREREARGRNPDVFDRGDCPDIRHLNGQAATCRACGLKILVKHTISAHQWGFMVQGYCGHIFPASLA